MPIGEVLVPRERWGEGSDPGITPKELQKEGIDGGDLKSKGEVRKAFRQTWLVIERDISTEKLLGWKATLTWKQCFNFKAFMLFRASPKGLRRVGGVTLWYSRDVGLRSPLLTGLQPRRIWVKGSRGAKVSIRSPEAGERVFRGKTREVGITDLRKGGESRALEKRAWGS